MFGKICFPLRPNALELLGNDMYVEGLNAAGWDEKMVQTFESALQNATQQTFCSGSNVS